MKFTNFIFYTGLWLYLVIVAIEFLIIQELGVSADSEPIVYMLMLIIPVILPVEITLVNRKREKAGHTDFGLMDALGKRKITEHETKEYMESAYPEIPSKYLSDVQYDLVIGKIGKKYIRVPIIRDGLNGFILGNVGSSKTTLLIGWLLSKLYLAKRSQGSLKWNFFVVDIKGEIYQKLLKIQGKYRAEDNHKIQVVQPSNHASWGWDVFYRIHKSSVTETEKLKAVTDIADALVQETGNNSYFYDNAKKILSGILYHYINQGYEFIPIVQMITRNNLDDLIERVVLEAEEQGEGIVLDKLKGFTGKQGNESIQDIQSTLLTYLDVFSYPDVIWALQLNPKKTSPSALDDGETNLDLAIEQGMLRTYQTLFRLITMQVLRHAEANFHETDERNTLIICDEASKIGRVEDLDGCMATLRSKHTGILLLFQSMHQFLDIYKQEKAYTILALCELKLFLSGDGDRETIEYVSTMAGEYKTARQNYDKKGIANSANDVKYSDEYRKIVNAESMMELREKKEAIAFIYGKYLRFKKFIYFEDKTLGTVYREIEAFNIANMEKEK